MILSLSGGGLNGLAYLGLFRYFESQGISHNQFKIYGSSIGAMFGTLWAMGYEAEFLIKLFVRNSFIPQANFSHLIHSYGLDDGQELEIILKNVISERFDEMVTLNEFKNVYICTCNISQKKIEYMSHETHPNLPVYLAIRMSCNLPFIFSPLWYENSLYIDAAAMENVPMPSLFHEAILFCRFESTNSSRQDTNTSVSECVTFSQSENKEPATFLKENVSDPKQCVQDSLYDADDKKNIYINYLQNIVSLANQDRFSLMERFISKIYPESYILKIFKPFHVCNFWIPIEQMNTQILLGYQTARRDKKLFFFLKKHLGS